MTLYSKLQAKEEKIAVIGLGYVGLPLAVELAKKYDVVGFDVNEAKLDKYKSAIDVTDEVGNEALSQTTMTFTNDEDELKKCKFHVVAVPTPINVDKTPNLNPVIGASRTVGRNLTEGSIVVYESTVYPGTTEEICIPILEEESGLSFGKDFKVGYSPERINPGDKVNTLTKITKIVSGSDDEALQEISALYGSIIEAGVFEAESIKVAEAAKVIENSQRDINIAFMNELSMVFNKMGISTKAVLEAAGTKWNFLKFTPGLVGGHCIGVDPYYFTYKAEQLGYHSQIILSGRKINDDMGKYIASNVIKKMIKAKQEVDGAKVAVLGLTFKENVGDVRNTKVIDIIEELKEYGVELLVHDPVADAEEAQREFGITLVDKEELTDLDAIVYAVPHQVFKDEYTFEKIDSMYKDDRKVLIDVKSSLERKECEDKGYHYWSL
ncbi:UDP-N-acetyl-D-galactosamine dehydrogenase [Thalassobacillus devorans]|uniref:UDP-N-acetyl-D-galactosamine dehydrogenase n=1 Tax=Thalassobacillus devorans TaxID=279813 RepID=A0ABQ1NXR9_9BACI|nr:nucleotide sugar dehydrogenase [Thalassobacillus devorans]NIK28526.1 UDP-N-acetyl-D-galactosamine dehydrogenase [Thalassobacillus devorans]GGC85531.1 UDP-N-acetyl-D-galactosamine dehydrogenase [Thalassobacillus devorans]